MKSEPLRVVRGMHDILPEQAERYSELEVYSREKFKNFKYNEIRIPVLESAELFQRAVGEDTDIVEKEMFTLKDRGDRLLCLRPEGTAGVVRSFIENNLAHKYKHPKFFYIAPMFRAERPQKGRYREFYQIGAEWFGDSHPAADVEVINILPSLLKYPYNTPVRILINSIGCRECRPAYKIKLLKYLESKKDELCVHCNARMNKNPLRILDCKEDASKLIDAPTTLDNLCRDCREHFNHIQESLNTIVGSSFSKVELAPRLVRGLDYYNRTVFEIYPFDESGSQDALAAGGRYDGLVSQLGGTDTPAVGFALGVERVLNYLDQTKSIRETKRQGIFFAPLGNAAEQKTREFVELLQKDNVSAYGGSGSKSLKSLLREADNAGFHLCVIIGDNELKENFVMLKNLKTQSQEKVPMNEIVQKLKSHYGNA